MSRLASDQDNKAIGARLAEVRLASRLSQADFAESLGISPRAFQNYERGEREVPATVLRALYKTYGADPVWLLDGPGQERRHGPDIRADLLERLMDEVDMRLARARKRLPNASKARVVALLYTHFREKKQFDASFVDQALSFAA